MDGPLSPDGIALLRRFERLGISLDVTHLCDRSMAEAYNALKDNGTSIQRTVYIIDGNGVIRFAQQGMPSDEELAEAIRNF